MIIAARAAINAKRTWAAINAKRTWAAINAKRTWADIINSYEFMI